MRVKYSPLFLKILKKVDVRIYKSLKERIAIFISDPDDPQLYNHALKDKYLGYNRSINITSDWRAVFEEIQEGEEIVAYFLTFGTHEQLYGKENKKES